MHFHSFLEAYTFSIERRFCFLFLCFCARMYMNITCVCFFRKVCLIHGKELSSNVGTVRCLITLFLSGKPEASREAVYRCLVSIRSPVTDNLLFLNKRKSEKQSMIICR